MTEAHRVALAKAEEAFDKCSSIRNSLEAACLAYAAALPVTKDPIYRFMHHRIKVEADFSEPGSQDWRKHAGAFDLLREMLNTFSPISAPPENPS